MRNHWRCHWGVKRPEFRSTTFNLHDLKKSSDFNVIVLMLNTGLRSAHCREIWKSKDTLSTARFISTNVQSLSCQCCRVENEDAADSGHKEQVMIMDSFFPPTLAPNHPQFLSSVYWISSLLPCHRLTISVAPHGNIPVSRFRTEPQQAGAMYMKWCHWHELHSYLINFQKDSNGFKHMGQRSIGILLQSWAGVRCIKIKTGVKKRAHTE